MRHLKILTRRSIFVRPLCQFSILNKRGFSQSTSKSLLMKVIFSESDIKPRQFMSVQKSLPFPQYIRQSINKFPYCKIPKYTQRFSEDKELTPEDYEKMVAFGCLFIVNEQNRQKQLRQMGQILMKQDFQNHQNIPLTGAQIFHWHYIKKLAEMVNQINEGKVTEEQITFNFQVLANLLPTPQVREGVERVKEEEIKKMSSHIQSLYLKLLLKVGLPSIHVIDHLYKCLISNSNQSESELKADLEAAKMLVNIENFQEVLSQNLKSQALKIITENIRSMDAVDHIEVIKHIYMSNSALCKNYIQKLTEEITELYRQKRGEEIHVPLMLKVIKYRSKIHVSNDMFIQIINAFPEKFNTVFRQKNMNKEIFLSLTSKQSSNSLNMQIKSQFGAYIQKVFGEYAKDEEINEDELVRNIKLMLKYGKDVRNQQRQEMLDILVNNVYPRAKHIASHQLKYYIFLVAHSLNFQNAPSLSDLNQQLINHYNSKCLKSPNSQDLSKMINIEYQLSRKQTDLSVRKNIFQYNYSNTSSAPVVYSYLFYLMKKGKSNGSSQEKTAVLDQLKKDIFKHLAHQKFSMKIIYTLIDVLDQIDYSDKFIYTDIERAIGRHLSRATSSQNKKNHQKNDMLLPKDISFLMHRLAKKQKCSRKFTNFLSMAIKNHNLIHQYAKQYLENAQNWENMRTNFKRNRQKQFNKYQTKGSSQNDK